MKKLGKFLKISCFFIKVRFSQKEKNARFFQNRAQKTIKSSQILHNPSLGYYLQNCFFGFSIPFYGGFRSLGPPKNVKIAIFRTLGGHKMSKIWKFKNQRKQFCGKYLFDCVYQILGLFEHFWALFWKKTVFFFLDIPP